MVEFKRREIVLIFVMLILVTAVIFGLGVFLGYEFKVVEQEAQKIADLHAIETVDGESNTQVTSPVTESSGTEISQTETADRAPAQPVSPKIQSEPQVLLGYTIQVDLLEDPEVARMERERLQKLGFPSVFVRESQVEQSRWYVVDVGYFESQEEAFRFADRLKSKGMITSYLIRKSNLPDDGS